MESICGICLGHPLVVKYVDIKWKRRGFSYTLAIILLALLCHICIMVYTTDVIGVVNYHRKYTSVKYVHVYVDNYVDHSR